jgi:hypothetical protein
MVAMQSFDLAATAMPRGVNSQHLVNMQVVPKSYLRKINKFSDFSSAHCFKL